MLKIIAVFIYLVPAQCFASTCNISMARFFSQKVISKNNIYYLNDWVELEKKIQEVVKKKGISSKVVVVRKFSRYRMNTTLQTGTDRNASSTLFDLPNVDSDAATRLENNVLDEHVTYAARMSFTESGLFDYKTEIDFTYWMKEFLEYDNFAVAIYDSKKLKRVTQAEFWFKVDPREALLGIVTLKNDITPRYSLTSFGETLGFSTIQAAVQNKRETFHSSNFWDGWLNVHSLTDPQLLQFVDKGNSKLIPMLISRMKHSLGKFVTGLEIDIATTESVNFRGTILKVKGKRVEIKIANKVKEIDLNKVTDLYIR